MGYTEAEMQPNAKKSEALPAGVVLKLPVSAEELKADTEHDPEGAEEFVALIRALRKEGTRPITL